MNDRRLGNIEAVQLNQNTHTMMREIERDKERTGERERERERGREREREGGAHSDEQSFLPNSLPKLHARQSTIITIFVRL